MPVEPVPTRPAGPSGRRAILSAAAPLAALGLVVIVALVGAPPDRPPAERPGPPPSPADEGVPIVPPLPGMDLSIAPRVAFSLPVRTVLETLAGRAAGEVGDGLVAVAGYVTLDPRVGECAGSADVSPDGLFCRRLVRVSARIGAGAPGASTDGKDAAGDPARSLRAHVLPGTPLPERLATPVRRRGDPERWPLAAVVIGRFGDPRASACLPARPQCGDPFVLERIAWADGQWIDRATVRDPAIPATESAMSIGLTRLLTSRESDRGEVILSEALLGVDVLRAIDPAAAAALGRGTAGRVWYVRSIGRDGLDRSGRPVWPVAWVVLDVEAGLVLATGQVE